MTEYPSKELYLIQWVNDNELSVTDGWNINAIQHQELKEKEKMIKILRPATKEDVERYGNN